MREIKFRAKRIKTNEWVYGTYLCSSKKGLTDYKFGEIKTSHWIMPVDAYYFADKVKIDIKTLGQYTGLNDKTGKEIYKGDVVKFPLFNGRQITEYVIGEVKFIFGAFKLFVKSNGAYDISRGNENLEVIGNIYENPELLK